MAPDVDRGDRDQRLVGAGEKRVAAHAEPGDQVVDAAEQRVEQPDPHQRHQHVGQQVGQQHHRLDEQRARQPVHRHREEQAEHDLQRDVEDHVVDRQLHAVPELAVFDHLGVVGPADRLRIAQQVPVGEADLQRAQRRHRIEQHEADQRRQHQQPAGGGLQPAQRPEGVLERRPATPARRDVERDRNNRIGHGGRPSSRATNPS